MKWYEQLKAPEGWKKPIGDYREDLYPDDTYDQAYSKVIRNSRVIKTVILWFFASFVYSISFGNLAFFGYMVVIPFLCFTLLVSLLRLFIKG